MLERLFREMGDKERERFLKIFHEAEDSAACFRPGFEVETQERFPLIQQCLKIRLVAISERQTLSFRGIKKRLLLSNTTQFPQCHS